MIPWWVVTASGLISGMTSGTAGSIRKALELSIITAPDWTIVVAHAFDVEPPAEAKTTSTPLKELACTASTGIASP